MGGLVWIDCTPLEAMSEGSNGLMDWIKNDLLLERELFSADAETSTTYNLWGFFRNFANILLGIILLIIILSQVTGIGIDNYGIKKMLPRVVVIGILLNLSYFICQLAIDISNIIGSTIGSEITSWANTAAGHTGGWGTSTAASIIGGVFYLLASGVGTVAIGGLSTSIAVASVTGTFAVWPFVVAGIVLILSAVITIAVFFATVVIRKVLAMLAVVIAPVAMICYILPNTEKLAKKWFDLFKGVIVVYPIIGAAQGVSSMIQVLTMQPGINLGLMGWIVYSVAPLIPLLIAPVVIRSSLRAIPGLEASISRIGSRAKAGVRQAGGMVNHSLMHSDIRNQRLVDKALVKNARPKRENFSSDEEYNNAESKWKQRQHRLGGLSSQQRLGIATRFSEGQAEREAQLNYLTSTGYLERRQASLEEGERQKAIKDQLFSIQQGGKEEYKEFNRGDATGGVAMMNKLVELLNKEKLTTDETALRDALAIQISRTKGIDKGMIDLVHDKNSDGSWRLTDTGLRNLNQVRVQNSDVGMLMGQKGTITSQYLADLATGKEGVSRNMSDAEVGARYAGTLSDDADVGRQSSAELERYANSLGKNQIRNFVIDPQHLQDTVPDSAKRDIILNTTVALNVQNEIEQQNIALSEAQQQAQQERDRVVGELKESVEGARGGINSINETLRNFHGNNNDRGNNQAGQGNPPSDNSAT